MAGPSETEPSWPKVKGQGTAAQQGGDQGGRNINHCVGTSSRGPDSAVKEWGAPPHPGSSGPSLALPCSVLSLLCPLQGHPPMLCPFRTLSP